MKALHALSDSNRRALLERLRAGPSSAGELGKAVSITQPAVSQHLRVLRRAGLVTVRRQGALRIYRLSADGVAELRRYVQTLWQDAQRQAE